MLFPLYRSRAWSPVDPPRYRRLALLTLDQLEEEAEAEAEDAVAVAVRSAIQEASPAASWDSCGCRLDQLIHSAPAASPATTARARLEGLEDRPRPWLRCRGVASVAEQGEGSPMASARPRQNPPRKVAAGWP